MPTNLSAVPFTTPMMVASEFAGFYPRVNLNGILVPVQSNWNVGETPTFRENGTVWQSGVLDATGPLDVDIDVSTVWAPWINSPLAMFELAMYYHSSFGNRYVQALMKFTMFGTTPGTGDVGSAFLYNVTFGGSPPNAPTFSVSGTQGVDSKLRVTVDSPLYHHFDLSMRKLA